MAGVPSLRYGPARCGREEGMARLGLKTLGDVKPGVRVPKYKRADVSAGIVHLGIGAFHRAHMAVYVDDLLNDDPSWGIVGASLRRPDTKEALEPQDGLYTVVTHTTIRRPASSTRSTQTSSTTLPSPPLR
jgi:mannitol-1-phosphate/altronate dehydrogenase